MAKDDAERLGRAILIEHARLRVVRRLLLGATIAALLSVVASVALLAGWLGHGPALVTLGWIAVAVSAIAVPVSALLATGVRRGRRYVLGMIAEYERLAAGKAVPR